MRNLVILGASGSIGKQTIDVCEKHPDEFTIIGLAVGKNVDYLRELLKKFDVHYACTQEHHPELAAEFPNVKFFDGDEGLNQMAQIEEYDLLVNALVGFTGFIPTLKAIEAKKDIALANKETLVAAVILLRRQLPNIKSIFIQLILNIQQFSNVFMVIAKKISNV